MMSCSKEYPFYAVCEETTPEGAKCEILKEETRNGELHFLRYRQCLQSFNKRNRNRRLWKAVHIRQSLMHPWLQQLFKKGGVPGESGHPVSTSGPLSMERLAQIDPERVCLYLKDYEFQGDDLLFGTIETADDGNGPGNKFMRSILQGIEPSVSCRSLVPQKKNPDGTIDVTGPGRLICYDRVYVPSHEEAFRDTKAATNSVTKNGLANTSPVFECAISDLDLTTWATNASEHAKFILDGLEPVLEAAMLDKNGMLSMPTNEGHVFIPLHDEKHIMDSIKDFMRK